ncbi:transmembrane protein 268 isoform X1 [Dendroctonus ponderosae]|uniref:Transmembrane protein 268 n=1 Tax=Dendroctonus ponderosae TaxID=77166 RepID=U4UYE3_DENPD|nr:transmembrane protein 268 isoform X1 [Dendroctonus ponderosae]ERL95391.1 hypothetical protein D910_12655 [Dendroctonus ponderosae]
MSDQLAKRLEEGHGNVVAPVQEPGTKSWVVFDDETVPNPLPSSAIEKSDVGPTKRKEPEAQIEGKKKLAQDNSPAVITTENVQFNLDKSLSRSMIDSASNSVVLDPKPLRNVELPVATVEPIRQGFSNGDIIVTLLPVNSRFPWITPAVFRPELVPEELMAQGLTLTVEEYVQAMELLVNDVRFTLYNVCYKRVLVVWITLAFVVLLSLLFSGTNGLTLFGLGIGWLVLNAAAIFLSMYVKFKLQRNLERCLAQVNKQLLRHKITLTLDDRGKFSCHKVNLCFIYMDSAPCIAHLQTSIEQLERDPATGWEQRMDITASAIVIQGSRTTKLSRKQERATLLYIRYIARWGRDRVRGLLQNPPTTGGRHCNAYTCPCQFIDEHLQCKPQGSCCLYLSEQNIQSEFWTSMHIQTYPLQFGSTNRTSHNVPI